MGLNDLRRLLKEMSDLAANSIQTSIESYLTAEDSLERVRILSKQLRAMQIKVSELSTELIARYQPVASDLRFIRSCMEVAYSYFRIGRYALDVAEVQRDLGDLSRCDSGVVRLMFNDSMEMLSLSKKAFLENDIESAEKVKELDDKVDSAFYGIMSKLEEGGDIRCQVSRVLIAKYIERIADHACYIAEATVYALSGEPSADD